MYNYYCINIHTHRKKEKRCKNISICKKYIRNRRNFENFQKEKICIFLYIFVCSTGSVKVVEF